MKILLVADLHYTLRQWDWLGVAAERFDLVVVAGDLLDIGSIVPLEAQILVVRKYFARLAGKAPLLVASGNHDILPTQAGGERMAAWLREDREEGVRVDGDHFENEELFFSILPWWDGPETRALAEQQLEEQARSVAGRRWIWIYHPPPQGSPTAWNGRRDLGDPHLCTWIERHRPDMVLGGHIHNAPFYADGSWVDLVGETWSFNSGKQSGGTPTFVIIDLDENTATWVAAGEAERVELKPPLQRQPL